jgi:hypothetical protein
VLRQLARLTRRLPAAGPRALAVAIYSGAAGQPFGARETGVEGVACVDDAARAAVLLSRLWVRTGNQELLGWAMGLLDFVAWMHAGDGGWVNFIYDWEGTKNLDGLTSQPGSNFWQARAIEALAVAEALPGAPRRRPHLEAGLSAAAAAAPPSDVRALHALAVLELLRLEGARAGRAPSAVRDPTDALNGWCDELVACQRDGVLMNSPDERGRPHLWAHIQEAVLFEAAGALDRDDLRVIARRSAGAVFGDVIASGFDLPQVRPYDVQAAVFVMDRLDPGAAASARAWFGGRNPAHAPVYQRDEGRVADGIDGGRLNDHSGAEANIAAGLALLDDPFVVAQAAAWAAPQLWSRRIVQSRITPPPKASRKQTMASPG